MTGKILTSLFALVALNAAALPPAGSDAYKEFYTWNSNKKLTWSDFRGNPFLNASEVAATASSVEFSYTAKNNVLDWKVTAKYYPQLSWSYKDKQSDYILQHEQLHFDITELYARLFRKRLTDEVKSVKDVKKINGIGKQILSDWDKEQKDYDRETNHSMNTQMQKEWIVNVHERMQALSDFASK
ncbi:MAG: DUF922 domain-containing protein [Sphingobacteriales bacterium]|nr:DUF922 domain-containing protein [Sphingobacteriales bacterium]